MRTGVRVRVAVYSGSRITQQVQSRTSDLTRRRGVARQVLGQAAVALAYLGFAAALATVPILICLYWLLVW